MDHQIQYHAHFRSSRIELRKTMNLDEHRAKWHVFQRQKGRVEPLHMAYLHLTAGFFCQLYQLSRLIHRMGQWLFHEHMLALFDSLFTPGKMMVCWGYDIDRVA